MKNNLPQTTLSFHTGCAARQVLAIAIVSVTLALPISAAIASSREPQHPAGKPTLVAGTPMQQQILRIERQMKKQQDQMQAILNQLMSMMQIMLEQLALQQEPSLYK